MNAVSQWGKGSQKSGFSVSTRYDMKVLMSECHTANKGWYLCIMLVWYVPIILQPTGIIVRGSMMHDARCTSAVQSMF